MTAQAGGASLPSRCCLREVHRVCDSPLIAEDYRPYLVELRIELQMHRNDA
jgi:hypothetical protein